MFNILVIFLFILVCWKWIFIIAYYPFVCMHAKGRLFKLKKYTLLGDFLMLPLKCCEKILRGGGKRFVLFNIATLPSLHLRKWLYNGLGVDTGKNVVIHFRTEIRCPERLKIGDGTIIGDNAILDARRGLTFGKNVNLSSNVSIYTLQHDHRNPDFACPAENEVKFSVEIDDRAWLGSNVIVLPGVHIGEGAVCCAGCVVTKDVEPYAVMVGIPAKKVGERPRNLRYEFKGKSCRLY